MVKGARVYPSVLGLLILGSGGLASVAVAQQEQSWVVADRFEDEPPEPVSTQGLGLWFAVHGEGGNLRFYRHFEPSTGEVRTYTARVYGGVGFALGYALDLSSAVSVVAVADYARSLALSSGARRLGKVVETRAQRVNAALGLALRPSGEQGLSLAPMVGVGAMGFDFSLPAPQSRDDATMHLATGNYTYLRLGLQAELPLSPARLCLGASYLPVFETGAFGSRRVAGSPQGMDGSLALYLRVLPWAELYLRAGASLLRFELSPAPERPRDATARARDLYLRFGLGAQVSL